MDIIGGLTAARLALDLAKDLREIDRSVDEAAFKLKLADLTGALADAQVALSDAKIRIAELEDQIGRLSSGDLCPVCRSGRLRVVDVQPHRSWIEIEIHKAQYANTECSYKTRRQYDTNRGIYTSKPE